MDAYPILNTKKLKILQIGQLIVINNFFRH